MRRRGRDRPRPTRRRPKARTENRWRCGSHPPVVEGDHHEYRAEDLLLSDRHRVVDVGEQGRLEEPTLGMGPGHLASDREGGALVDALLDVAEDPPSLLVGDHRPHHHVVAGRIAVRHTGEERAQHLHALVVARAWQQHPGLDGAALAGVEARRHAHHDRLVEGRVLEHDRGGLAAQLEEQALHRLAAFGHDALAHGRRTGERDEVDLRRERQSLPDEMIGRRDDVEDARRDVSLLGDELGQASGVERRVRGGLEHHRVPGRQGLSDLVEDHLEREVPRRDGPDDARGLAHELAGRSRAHRVVGVGQLLDPRKGVHVLHRPADRRADGAVELGPQRRHHGTPDLGDELGPEGLLLGLERGLQLREALLAEVPARGPVGAVERAAGGVDRPLHLGGGRVRDCPEHLLRGGVDVLERRPGIGIDQLPVDEHPRLASNGHWSPVLPSCHSIDSDVAVNPAAAHSQGAPLMRRPPPPALRRPSSGARDSLP